MKAIVASAVLVLTMALAIKEAYGADSGSLRRFDAQPGSKVTVEGQSNIHGWKAEGTIAAGFVETGEGFPNPKSSRDGRIQARAEVFIPVRNLKGTWIDRTWEPDQVQLTDAIHKLLHADEHPKIIFRLTELKPGAARQSSDGSSNFSLAGGLSIAGVTNQVFLPIQVRPVGSSFNISGAVEVKQSDFKIIPRPTAFYCFGGDPDTVRISFEWLVAAKQRR